MNIFVNNRRSQSLAGRASIGNSGKIASKTFCARDKASCASAASGRFAPQFSVSKPARNMIRKNIGKSNLCRTNNAEHYGFMGFSCTFTLQAENGAVARYTHKLESVSISCQAKAMASRRTKFRNLSKKVEKGEIVRLARGIYARPDDLQGIEGDFYRATLLAGKRSAICLFSALQFYGLTEQMFGGVWILVPYSSTPPHSRAIRAVRSRNPRLRIGISREDRYNITTIERTLVDVFRYRKLVGMPTAVDALKKAVKSELTTKNKIFSMAKRLNAEKTILPYLESV